MAVSDSSSPHDGRAARFFAKPPSTTRFSLNVDSSGASRVSIDGSPGTYGGRTDYSVNNITAGTSFTLTAPETSGNFSFSDWSGCDSAAGNVCSHTMTGDATLTANYAAVPTTFTLNVNSSGASKVSISGSPGTYGGKTDYSVTKIASGTSLTLTAPETSGNFSFSGWSGCDSAAGNVCSHTIKADTTLAVNYVGLVPTVPTGLTVVGTSTKAIYLSWNSSTDNIGVTGYDVYRDGTLLASSGKQTSYTDTGLAASTVHSYSVAACDAGGSCSAQSPPVSAATNPPSKAIASIAEVVAGESPSASIDSDGALVIAPSADQRPPTVALKTDGTVNVDVKLPPGKPVIFSSNGATQQVTDVSGQSQFLTTSKDGVTQVELVKGQVKVEVDKSGTSVSVTSSASFESTGALVTKLDKTTIAVVKDETKALVFVDSGKIDYIAGHESPIAVFQGENGTIDPGGKLVQLALGSQDGQKQLPGDPLPVEMPKDNLTKVPNLEGTLPRFENTLSLLDIVGDAIREATGDGSGRLSYDKTTGVIAYELGRMSIRLIALGDVLVQLNQFAATTISANAGVAYSLASRGIEMSLAGALGYFSDLQSVVKSIDSAGLLSLKPTGAIEIRLAGARHVVMPGVTAQLPGNPNPLPGFDTDAGGFAVFRDHLGTLQTLYPTFLDPDRLNLVFAVGVPSLRLTNNGNGTVTAAVAGQTLTLRPEYTVIDRPVGHDSDTYWLDNGIIYFRNSDLSAQGFRLQ
ncbi:MAG: fibronectin type III domain-containing protein [Sterolibacterium sp.]